MAKRAGEVITETMFYVLMAFSQGPMCGVDVADYVEKQTRGRVILGAATLYTILGRFEKDKWIEEIGVEWRKRTYRITGKGLCAYEQEVERLQLCIQDAQDAKQVL